MEPAPTHDGQRRSLTCFGVGDGWPCADRNHSAFLYQLDGVTLLVDCGEPVSGSFKATGLSYDIIDRIFISHLHSDHVAGFFMLLQGFWLEQRKKDLPVHLPADGIEPIRQLLRASMLFDDLLPFRMGFEPLGVGQGVTTGGVRVTPFASSHLDRLKELFQGKYPLEFAAYSFLIESDTVRIGHSADIGRPEDLEPLLAKPLDLLVCELAHFEPGQLFEYLRGRDIKRVVFTHLARQYWEDLETVHRLASEMLPDTPFLFARDKEEILL